MPQVDAEPAVSLIVPARNEAGTIQRVVDELPRLGSRTEVIFVEGHSLDDTWHEIERVAKAYRGPHSITYVQQRGEGKADAVITGFELAAGEILIIYDADMSVPADETRFFYDALRSHEATFVNGTRFVYPMEKGSMYVLNYFGNKFFTLIFRWLSHQKITDTLCGTKALWKKDYLRIKAEKHFFGNYDPFGDFDLLFGAARLQLRIVEVPIHYKERVYGSTNISRWKHGWLLLKMSLFAVWKVKVMRSVA